MKLRIAGLAMLVLMSACRTVVTTTTEVRPSRYAVVEFTRQIAPDSVLVYAARSAQAENLTIQKVDREAGTVIAGPVKIAESAGLPALEALITIAARSSGPETTVRITASSAVEANQMGGTDARLMELVQRVQKHMEEQIGQ
ncbi:MAG TPA: hypothetical protein VF021_09665 [Longimicrobiales bacterium]